MFSISAINDTDSKEQWEPLAPTKEAQEFHVIQTYHDGLLKLQAKEYAKAQELLENVLNNPLVSSAQVENTAGDGHLLQLRFLALKNLATVFLQQGSAHYESALHCYVQAVEIDTKDSVVWNQLGTLSCEMGLLSMSRWAFEQGLLCSPNNWNCMEKLLEVLIAIGDEVACLSLAELILRHWPSHSRAFYVKSTIQETETVPFAPRGIDKLEPRHARLKFLGKRKASDENSDVEIVSKKRLNQTIELQLEEVSWTALVDAILEILRQRSRFTLQQGDAVSNWSADTNVSICLPSKHVKGTRVIGTISFADGSNGNSDDPQQKEVHMSEEQTHERRSSRLGRLRSHRSGKEETEFPGYNDAAEAKVLSLECFIVRGQKMKDFDDSVSSIRCLDARNLAASDYTNVIDFVKETSKNWGAYHLGHMLLEKVARLGLPYHDTLVKFLDLERLTRNWACDRSPECSLFLAELYHDIGRQSSDANGLSDCMSEASYHLCKIVESVSLDYPLNSSGMLQGNSCYQEADNSQRTSIVPSDVHIWQTFMSDGSVSSDKTSFWVRFFWLSGNISMWEQNMEKAYEEFSISLSLLENNKDLKDVPGAVCLPYCKLINELSVNQILRQIHLLEARFLMNKKVGDMIAKEMYTECIDLLAPLLFTTNPILSYPVDAADKGEQLGSFELSVLDILIELCEKVKPLNVEVYLNCHQYKLQMLMMAAGMDRFGSCKQLNKLGPNLAVSDTQSKGGANKHWINLIAAEVKALSRCASEVKNWIDQTQASNCYIIPTRSIGHVQVWLLDLMVNIAKTCFCKKTSGVIGPDQAEQKQKCCYIDAAIAFCKLQHLDRTVATKDQVALITAIHDMLAEYGICCVGEDGEGADGTFLKVAIKHLLALDTELKSYSHSLDKGLEASISHSQVSDVDVVKKSSEVQNMEMDQTANPSSFMENANQDASSARKMKEAAIACSNRDNLQDATLNDGAKSGGQMVPTELTEDEREELEVAIDDALDQCFFCLYGLNLRSESSYDDDLAVHKNTNSAEYQSKEQCAEVFKYILPYAMASTRTGLLKLRRVLRAIHKHFPQPPDDVLIGNSIDKFLDNPTLCEDKLWEETASDQFVDTMTKTVFPDIRAHGQSMIPVGSAEPYMEVYGNLFYLLALSEETSATDKWPGFVLTEEGAEFVQRSANLFKYDLLFNPFRFESWQRLANIYDEDVDLLLNDGSKHINAAGWRKHLSLPQRVETSRRRSRRCLLISLALAKTAEQQEEIHEMLALVYYDGVQNVVPFYDQRTVAPSRDATWRMFCENSVKHFKQAFAQKRDWSHVFYLGKLCEKLGKSSESFSYYQEAIALNPTAVDPVYRMHGSRLKMLSACQRQDMEALKVAGAYCYSESTKETVMDLLEKMSLDKQHTTVDKAEKSSQNILIEERQDDSCQLVNVWQMLYDDCLSALKMCVEGDLKHFHKARYMLALGFYRRGDLEKAKEELSFCFKSSRSAFTVNMWEIYGMVKKGRRKTPSVAGNKKILEVNLPESSRKFISCIRKYLLFYLELLEETGDIHTLDRAYASIRGDKRFSLCLEDLVPVTLGRYLKALMSSIESAEEVPSAGKSSSEQIREKMFSLFMEQGSLWGEICSLPEIKCPEFTESTICGHLHQHIYSLESSAKLETLEAINEKIRKRFKNPKLSHSGSARVCKHASIAWSRSLIVKLALITPLQTKPSDEVHLNNSLGGVSDKTQILCVDLQTNELWNPSFGNAANLATLQTKWDPLLSKIKNLVIKKASEDNMETANSLLRSAYNFYRDSSSVVPTSGVNLYLVPARLATTVQLQPGVDGIEIVDVSVPRKLLMWAYTLLHGRYTNISAVVKYCEENAKSRVKKGVGSSPAAAAAVADACVPAALNAQSATGASKDEPGHIGCGDAVSITATAIADPAAHEAREVHEKEMGLSSSDSLKTATAPQLHRCHVSRDRMSFDLNDDPENLEKS